MTRHEIIELYPRASESFIQANLSDYNSGPVAKLECDPGHEPLATKEIQGRVGEKFLVRIGCRRKRLLDWDNICPKYLIDLLRYGCVLSEDTPEICEIEIIQAKCGKAEAEEITIEVFRKI